MRVAQSCRRGDTQLLVEAVVRRAIDAESLLLLSGRGQSQHVVGDEHLAERVASRERREVCLHGLSPPERERRLGVLLPEREPLLVEEIALYLDRRRRRDALEHLVVEQRERLTERLKALRRSRGGEAARAPRWSWCSNRSTRTPGASR